jgi:hypothetical protein
MEITTSELQDDGVANDLGDGRHRYQRAHQLVGRLHRRHGADEHGDDGDDAQ